MGVTFNHWPTFEDRLHWSDELLRGLLPLLGGVRTSSSAGVFPPVNIYDNGDSFMVRVEIPGVGKESLDVSVKDRELTLRGERKVQPASPEANYHRRECAGGQFRRVVSLPEVVDGERISATYTNGVLEVRLPRAPRAQVRKISVQ